MVCREGLKCLGWRQVEAIVPLLNLRPTSHKAIKLVPHLRLHQPGWHCVTCLGDPQRFCLTQFTGPPKLLFHNNGWSWLLNPIKQATAGLASLSPGCSQIRVTAWLHLGISKPSTSSSHLTLLYSSGRVPQAKHRWRLTLSCTTLETPGPIYPVDSYRPYWSTSTLSLHSWSSTEGRGGWSAFTASPCSTAELTGAWIQKQTNPWATLHVWRLHSLIYSHQ